MRKLKSILGKMKRIENKSRYLTVLVMVAALLITQATPVFADFNGNTVKTNFIDNVIKPLYTIAYVGLLVKDFAKKNTGSLIIIAIIGGFVGVFVFYPELIQTVIGFIKGLAGV